MQYTVKFCACCAKTKENSKDLRENMQHLVDFDAGYLFEYDLDDDGTCLYCGSSVVDTQITEDDFLAIRTASNFNRQLLEAMIELRQKDVIEYELKMSQFRAQAEQIELAQEQKRHLKAQAERPKRSVPCCPRCHSTNIAEIPFEDQLLDAAVFGALCSDDTMQCNYCGYTW